MQNEQSLEHRRKHLYRMKDVDTSMSILWYRYFFIQIGTWIRIEVFKVSILRHRYFFWVSPIPRINWLTARSWCGPLLYFSSQIDGQRKSWPWRLYIRRPISYGRTSQNTKWCSAKYLVTKLPDEGICVPWVQNGGINGFIMETRYKETNLLWSYFTKHEMKFCQVLS